MPEAYTDYPIHELGDRLGAIAPVRKCRVLSYDGNKYCRVEIEGVTVEIKRAYIYAEPGRCGEVPRFDVKSI